MDQSITSANLKVTLSIEQFLLTRGIHLRRHGESLVGPCPVHGGDNPGAFVVNRIKNVWYCFTGCGTGGDIIDLVRRLDGIGYRDALQTLGRVPNVTIPSVSYQNATATERRFQPYTRQLWLDPFSEWLKKKGISSATARRFEVGAYHGQGMLKRCVAVRIHDPQGNPLGYAGRRLDPEETRRRGKWIFPRGLPKGDLLYGYHLAMRRRPRTIAMTECPWGVLRLAQLRIKAVALLGTTLTKQQQALLPPGSRIVLLMDADDVGRMATERIQRQLCGAFEVGAVRLPSGHDPDDLDDARLLKTLAPFFPF